MIHLEPPFRPASREDAPALAELVNMAGEDLPFYLWTGMAEAGEDPWCVGRRRALRETGSFSYRNAVVLEKGGRAIGCLIGYPLPDAPEPINWSEMPAMFVPLQELENLAPSTWYVNVLAIHPEYRGRGNGRRLLALADRIAAAAARTGLGIIVSDANVGARRLYERHGCQEIAKRTMVKDGWVNAGRNWVLLVKTF